MPAARRGCGRLGAARTLTTDRATALLGQVTPTSTPAVVRHQIAADLVDDVRTWTGASPPSSSASPPRSPRPRPAWSRMFEAVLDDIPPIRMPGFRRLRIRYERSSERFYALVLLAWSIICFDALQQPPW